MSLKTQMRKNKPKQKQKQIKLSGDRGSIKDRLGSRSSLHADGAVWRR
jgi:hypothetical protein